MQLKGKPHQELEIATLKKNLLKKEKEKTKRERKKEYLSCLEGKNKTLQESLTKKLQFWRINIPGIITN